MEYLALGDSMSIDLYTGVACGGAVSQFARRMGADAVRDLTFDGCTTDGVLQELKKVDARPDVVTLTAGGNDLILMSLQREDRREAAFIVAGEASPGDVPANLTAIAEQLSVYHCLVILNTVYDPRDGDDTLLESLDFTPAFRLTYERVNEHIRQLAGRYGFQLADLAMLFRGHGMAAEDSWVTLQIEPNLAGATAIADCWYQLWRGARGEMMSAGE